MAGRTVVDLVNDICGAALALGMDVSPSDTAFIISSFLTGLADSCNANRQVDEWLIYLADEVSTVRDE